MDRLRHSSHVPSKVDRHSTLRTDCRKVLESGNIQLQMISRGKHPIGSGVPILYFPPE